MDRIISGVVELGGDSGALAPRPFPPLNLSPFLIPLPLIDSPSSRWVLYWRRGGRGGNRIKREGMFSEKSDHGSCVHGWGPSLGSVGWDVVLGSGMAEPATSAQPNRV